MMLVTAVVEPLALGEVRSGLDRLDVAGMTVSRASGVGHRRGRAEVHRGADHPEGPVPTVRVEVVVDDALAEDVVEAVLRAAGSGSSGDGRVWVMPVDTAVRVRTGERGADAL